jgi:hypothetical protein
MPVSQWLAAHISRSTVPSTCLTRSRVADWERSFLKSVPTHEPFSRQIVFSVLVDPSSARRADPPPPLPHKSPSPFLCLCQSTLGPIPSVLWFTFQAKALVSACFIGVFFQLFGSRKLGCQPLLQAHNESEHHSSHFSEFVLPRLERCGPIRLGFHALLDVDTGPGSNSFLLLNELLIVVLSAQWVFRHSDFGVACLDRLLNRGCHLAAAPFCS